MQKIPKQDTKLQINEVHWLWYNIIFVEPTLCGSKLFLYKATCNSVMCFYSDIPVAWIAVPLHFNDQVYIF